MGFHSVQQVSTLRLTGSQDSANNDTTQFNTTTNPAKLDSGESWRVASFTWRATRRLQGASWVIEGTSVRSPQLGDDMPRLIPEGVSVPSNIGGVAFDLPTYNTYSHAETVPFSVGSSQDFEVEVDTLVGGRVRFGFDITNDGTTEQVLVQALPGHSLPVQLELDVQLVAVGSEYEEGTGPEESSSSEEEETGSPEPGWDGDPEDLPDELGMDALIYYFDDDANMTLLGGGGDKIDELTDTLELGYTLTASIGSERPTYVVGEGATFDGSNHMTADVSGFLGGEDDYTIIVYGTGFEANSTVYYAGIADPSAPTDAQCVLFHKGTPLDVTSFEEVRAGSAFSVGEDVGGGSGASRMMAVSSARNGDAIIYDDGAAETAEADDFPASAGVELSVGRGHNDTPDIERYVGMIKGVILVKGALTVENMDLIKNFLDAKFSA